MFNAVMHNTPNQVPASAEDDLRMYSDAEVLALVVNERLADALTDEEFAKATAECERRGLL